MITINFSKYQKHFVAIYFFVLFLFCWLVSDDYGVTLDDEHYYKNGLSSYLYVKYFFLSLFNQDINLLEFKSKLKEWPTVFELLLISLSKILNLNKFEDIYFLSHKLNFLIFFSSLIVFYKLISKRFDNEFLSLCSVTFLIFSPRIFAESFYNSRDIFFLSLFIFYIYYSYKFVNKSNIQNTILFSIFTALLVNAKIVGLIPFGLFIIFYFYNYLHTKKKFKSNINNLLIYLILSFLFIYLFWPYLWADPINNLIFAFKNILSVHEAVTVMNLYFGSYAPSDLMPWHYRIVWLIITTPIFVILLFIFGIFYTIPHLFKLLDKSQNNKFQFNEKNFIDLFLFFIFTLSLIIVVEFNKSKYGGWRHLYYLYPIIIYFSISALQKILSSSKLKNYRIFFAILISINLFYNLFWIFKNHPHQYVFFNSVFKSFAIKNFDLDWWGISHKSSLKYILKNDQRLKIKVFAEGFTSLRDSYLSLDEKDRNRIILSDYDSANYIIDNKMKRIRVNNNMNENNRVELFYELIIDGRPVTSIYKQKNL